MNLKRLLVLVSLPIIYLLLTTKVMAFGLGAFGTYRYMSADLEYDLGDAIQADYNKFGGGFIMDTAVATNRIFNYRLNVGYYSFSIDHERDLSDVSGIYGSMDNTFGFGIVRNESFRFWIGPSVGFGVVFFDGKYEAPTSGDYIDVSFFIGAAAGINIHLSEKISLGLEAGIRENFIIGSRTYKTTDEFYGDEENSDTFAGMGVEGLVNVSILYRFPGDYYVVNE